MKTSPEQVAEALRVSLKEGERLRQRNRRLQEAAAEPIAIVGMACRYPGGVDSPRGLWRLLESGADAIGEFPSDREWDLEALRGEDASSTYVREGGFLDRAAEFDNDFFGISPREALGMDAQQRLLLEVAWEALEDAGLVPARLRGSQTGVFAGAMYHDYGWGRSADDESAAYLATGGTSSIVSSRISYSLGLEGPAISVDTACSSSLVALHLATQALRSGECELALAGGATVYSSPDVFVQFGRQRVLAPDGRCKAFAEGADGAGFSEGAGIVLLERLSDAQANGRRVLATIRGSAVNQDGASNGITAPNGPSQERVIARALENARLSAAEVGVIEAHGTGTALGDPIEAGALLATYGRERPAGDPLLLGTIKSNIGHPQAAAGVAGVIKMALAMREGMLPRTLHAERPSTQIDWSAGRLELLTQPRPWPRGERPRRAGISSFGASGTNAHLILEEAPDEAATGPQEGDGEKTEPGRRLLGEVFLCPLSAKTEPALREQAARLTAHLGEQEDLRAVDVAYTVATARTSFERRAAVVAHDRQSLLRGLAAVGTGDAAAVAERAAGRGKVAFVFSGQGGQWPRMGMDLLQASPAFASHMQECERALEPFLEWSLTEALGDEEGRMLDRLEVVQPALFAVMVSLARLWRECGVEPSVVVGHSMGEIAAAHVAGAFSLDDAARLVAVRSQLISKLVGSGALASVALSHERLEARLREWGGRVEVAALNGPGSAIVAGETEALAELLDWCEAEGVRSRQLPATMASHSKHVEVLREEVLEAFAPISPRSGEIPFHSTVTGEPMDTAELGPEYWYRNLRETVRLEPAVRSLLESGRRTLIEIGPHPVLAFGLQETVEAAAPDPDSVAVLGSLRRGEGGPQDFALALAQAHAAGAPLDWEALFAGTGASAVALPTYPFQRRRYWLAAAGGGGDAGSLGQSDPGHPLLGAKVEDPEGGGFALTGRISLQTHPWLADHALAGTPLFPGTGFLELALAAAREAGAAGVSELTLQAPLALAESGAHALSVSVSGPAPEGREVKIHSRPQEGEEGEWTLHAQGLLAAGAAPAPEPLGAWPPPGAEPLEGEDLYQELAAIGFDYGPAFQGLVAAWRAGEDLYAEVALAPEQAGEADRYELHPALLDSCGHAVLGQIAREAPGEGEEGGPALPFCWQGVSLHAAGAAELRVRIEGQGGGLSTYSPDGAPVLGVSSLQVRKVDPARLRAADPGLPLHAMAWAPLEAPAAELPATALLGAVAAEVPGARPYPDLDALLGAIAAGEPAPELVVAAPEPAPELPAAALQSAEWALGLAQRLLAAPELGEARLCLLSAGAIAAAPEEDPELAAAPIWGLLRSAASEHPGRFALLDTDASPASQAALPAGLALGGAEPQIALREGRLLAPRLTRAPLPEGEPGLAIDPERTVLITGATSGLGALLARHLAERHGARHLLLVSRSGERAPGAGELAAELEALGAQVRISACDVSRREELAALLGEIPSEHPLGAVVHSAGVLDDGVLVSLDRERLDRVMAPKAQAAWHLHELTAGLELSAFVLFSSAAGLLGGPGQANYAAANSFLDALAAHRRAAGLAAHSLAWGGWEQKSSLVGEELAAEKDRFFEQVRERIGVVPMSSEQGLALFDAALALPEALLAPVAFDRSVLRAQAAAGTLAPVLRGLVRVPARRATAAAPLGERLARLPEAEREEAGLEFVRGHVAAVLGHASAAEIDPDAAFKELGFDSLAAVELRNRLVAESGLRLAPTVVFDYPSPRALARLLGEELAGRRPSVAPAAVPARSEEPIAIVGISCRYPGGADSPERLWELLREGRDAISEFPADRGWDLERLYDPDPATPGTSYARHGGFVPGSTEFDPGFFGISPREALAMDPQERELLEASWEALEAAGIDPQRLKGSATGVFAGVMYQDYASGALDGGAGMTSSAVTGRVSYALGLEGPAVTVDTACSSSLVALHLASQALRGGECELALAGGVTVLSTPGVFTFFSRQQGLAPDGRCKSFSEGADGTGISEGVGMLVLERLSDAQANGHRIYATIRGSAVNQDGASNGLTAPNGPSQERVIRQALANAGLSPAEVDAVEAHGTGTTLGDPIEAGALLATYGQGRREPLRLGSIKSNIGHTQAAAGVAGVIKMALAMREGVLPKTLHAERPSAKVDWSAGEVELLAEPVAWEATEHPRRAGVSSFGISGTNAHVILEQAPEPAPAQAPEPEPEAAAHAGPLLFALSAKSEPALTQAAARLASHLGEHPELAAADLAYSLATTRAHLEHRAVAVASDREELAEALAALAQSSASARTATGLARPGKLAYLFSGQGSQRPQMGRELYEADPAYREALEEALAALDPHLEIPLADVLFAAPGSELAAKLEDTTYTQPALFATGLALHRALAARGLAPGLLAGHSVGEITAAHLAGVFSLADAARLVSARGALMGALPAGGAMVAVAASEEEVAEAIAGREAEVAIAALNGPRSLVLSGRAEAVAEAAAALAAKGAKTKRLEVSHAFHSPLIEPILGEFQALLAELGPAAPKIPLLCGQSGEPLTPEQARDPAHWAAQARQPVRFAAALAGLAERGATAFLEIGPGAVLLGAAAETFAEQGREGALIPTLRRGRPEPDSLALALAQAHAAGAPLDWEALFAGTGASAVALPTYPFQRRRYWLAAAGGGGDAGSLGQSDPGHPLLGAKVEDPEGGGFALTGRISLQTHPWLADHALAGTPLFPGTGFLELALAAAREAGAAGVSELTLQAPLALAESGAHALSVSVSGPAPEGREVKIHSRPQEGEEGEWTLHAQGLLATEAAPAPEPLGAWPPPGAEPLEGEDLYQELAAIGFDYGPAFQGLVAAWRAGEDLYAEVALAPEQAGEADRYELHPALLDSCGHAVLGQIAREAPGEGEEGGPALPFCWQGVSLHAAGAAELRVRIEGQGGGLSTYSPDGAPVLGVSSLQVRKVDPARLRAADPGLPLHAMAWAPLEAPAAEPPATAILGSVAAAVPGARPYPDLDALLGAIAAGEPAPELVVAAPEPAPELPAAALQSAEWALGLAQRLLAAPELGEARLCLLSAGAIAAAPEEDPELAAAPIWGLLRSAASEHPGRFALLDTDASPASQAALPAGLALGGAEPQIALREGRLLAPRLTRAPLPEGEPGLAIDPERTVLITGATSGLGALLARHLAERHGARHLLLVSRSGERAPGAGELAAELEALGAQVRISACDVSRREELAALLGEIPSEHPLGAVVHSAGVLDDGVLVSLDRERLDRVMAPKAQAAWHLHELTAGLELSAFVLFSSAAGLLGGPGQANYAAANSFLDALAAHRRAGGLAAHSLAWGAWSEAGGMTEGLSGADLARAARSGLAPMSSEQGLALFDAALALPEALLAPVAFDRSVLRAQAAAGTLAPVLRGLVPLPAQRAQERRSLPAELSGVAAPDRFDRVLALVRAQVAVVLGHASAAAIDPETPFGDLGFDSLAAVELRNRLNTATGFQLPPTLVFDYPSAARLAEHLLEEAELELNGSAPATEPGEAEAALAKLSGLLPEIRHDGETRERISARVRALLADLEEEEPDEGEDLAEMSHDEVFELIDKEFG